MAHVVGQFEDEVIHQVQHDHFQEVMLLEGFGEDDLVRDALGVAVGVSQGLTFVLDCFLLASELVFAGPGV